MRSEYKPSDFAGLERGKFYGNDDAKRPSTRMTWHVKSLRADVYRALLDPEAVAQWKVPAGMTCRVHTFDPCEGGSFRISLTYDEPTGTGKTTAQTDTYHGRFAKLAPDEQVVEMMEFETADDAMGGEMTATTLTDGAGGTDVVAVNQNGPPGVASADNEAGWRQALDKLAALVEATATAAGLHPVQLWVPRHDGSLLCQEAAPPGRPAPRPARGARSPRLHRGAFRTRKIVIR